MQVLQKEFEAEPEQETQELYEAILHQQCPSIECRASANAVAESSSELKPAHSGGSGVEGASASLSFEPGGLAPGSGEVLSPPNNFPAQTTSFIGRETEIAAVSRLLSRPDIRLLTLIGAGGTGKTRLSLRVAAELLEQYADGVFFVSLASISHPDLVIPTIMQTLGLQVAENASPLDVLIPYVQSKSLLFVLDNFEQLLDAAPVLIDLLAAALGLKMLVTSRSVLHLSGEHEYLVPPLNVPDPTHLPPFEQLIQSEAVRLFAERAQAIHPDFILTTETTPVVAKICAWLDGLPLAIELAAVRIRMLTLHEILSRLDHRLKFLTGGARDLPARQRMIRETIEWSYELLEDKEKTLFHRLGVFVGGWTLDAAEDVCIIDDDVDAFNGLESLVANSLITQSENDHKSRFHMLETIRAYALERLAKNGEEETMRQQHAQFFLALAQKADPEMFGTEPTVWIERLTQDHNNLRTALTWAVDHAIDVEVQLAGALGKFWHVSAQHREGCQWLKNILATAHRCNSAEDAYLAKALYEGCRLAHFQNDVPTACAWGEESVALYREIGDTRGLANALREYGAAVHLREDLATARSLVTESVDLFRRIDDNAGLTEALLWHG